MEQLQDSYASDSLVKLAKDLGFNAEPSVIDLANNREQYTLSVIQKWFREEKQIHVYCIPALNEIDWVCKVRYAFARDTETIFSSKYDYALEEGLREACMILKSKTVTDNK